MYIASKQQYVFDLQTCRHVHMICMYTKYSINYRELYYKLYIIDFRTYLYMLDCRCSARNPRNSCSCDHHRC